MKTKKISIESARQIANNFGYTQVVIFALNERSGVQHVTTYGTTGQACQEAADAGNKLKKALGWPDEFCHAKPERS